MNFVVTLRFWPVEKAKKTSLKVSNAGAIRDLSNVSLPVMSNLVACFPMQSFILVSCIVTTSVLFIVCRLSSVGWF